MVIERRIYLILILVFLISLSILSPVHTNSSPGIVTIKTDKDIYTAGETVKIVVSIDPNFFCLCSEHKWEVKIIRISDGSVVKRWYWKASSEPGFRSKTLYWSPSEGGKYKIVATLITHNVTASKEIEVIGPGYYYAGEIEEYIYSTNDFDLKIEVPKYLRLSTPLYRVPNSINVYLRKRTLTLSGLLTITLEGGVKVMVSVPFTVSLWVFVDVDIDAPGMWQPDVFQLKWPILLKAFNLERGEPGAYVSLIPKKTEDIYLETLSTGKWYKVCSYDLYVNVEAEYFATLGYNLPAEETGAVECTILEEPLRNYKELYENLMKEYTVLKENYTALKNENYMLKERVSDLEETINELRAENSLLKDKISSLQQTLHQKESYLNVLKDKLVLLEAELSQWRMLVPIIGVIMFAVGFIVSQSVIKILKRRANK